MLIPPLYRADTPLTASCDRAVLSGNKQDRRHDLRDCDSRRFVPTQATENVKSSRGTSAPADSTTHKPKTALDSLAAPGYVDAAKDAVRQVGDKVASVLPASFTTAPARETPIEAAEYGTSPHGHEKELATPTTIADYRSETGKNAEQTREVGYTRVANPFDDKVSRKSVGLCKRRN